jgi:hypothetical protein
VLTKDAFIPFPEIVAHVAHENQILAFLMGEPPLQAGQCLFGGVERQRCTPGNKRSSSTRRCSDEISSTTSLSKPTLAASSGADESGSENKILHARRPDQSGEPADVRHREAIPSVRAIGNPIFAVLVPMRQSQHASMPAPPPVQTRAIVGTRHCSSWESTRSRRDSYSIAWSGVV